MTSSYATAWLGRGKNRAYPAEGDCCCPQSNVGPPEKRSWMLHFRFDFPKTQGLYSPLTRSQLASEKYTRGFLRIPSAAFETTALKAEDGHANLVGNTGVWKSSRSTESLKAGKQTQVRREEGESENSIRSISAEV